MSQTKQNNRENLESVSGGEARYTVKLWSVFWTVAWIILILMLVLRIFVYQQVNVVGSSMEPNYFTDQRLLVNRRNKTFQRGQVVAAYSDPEVAENATPLTPYDPSTRFFLKRIIGLPGESIEVIGGSIIIYNDQFPEGRILEESYIPASTVERQDILKEYVPKTEIPLQHYYLVGDNRSNSQDSRNTGTGPFPDFSIFGQETFRYWPISEAHLFELPEYTFTEIDRDFEQKREEYIETANSPVVTRGN